MSQGVTTNIDPHPQTLGEIIEARRLELGLTKSAAARLAGVSRGTWHEVEGDKRTNMLADTLNLFDVALRWDRGTLRRISRPLATSTPNDDSALRQRLATYADTLSIEQVRRIVDDINQRPTETFDLAETLRLEMRAQLAELEARLTKESAGERSRPTTRRARTAPR